MFLAVLAMAAPAHATMDNTATVTGTPRGGTLAPASDSNPLISRTGRQR